MERKIRMSLEWLKNSNFLKKLKIFIFQANCNPGSFLQNGGDLVGRIKILLENNIKEQLGQGRSLLSKFFTRFAVYEENDKLLQNLTKFFQENIKNGGTRTREESIYYNIPFIPSSLRC